MTTLLTAQPRNLVPHVPAKAPTPTHPPIQTVTRSISRHTLKRRCPPSRLPKAGFIGLGIPNRPLSGVIRPLGRMASCRRRLMSHRSSVVTIFRILASCRSIFDRGNGIVFMMLSVVMYGMKCIYGWMVFVIPYGVRVWICDLCAVHVFVYTSVMGSWSSYCCRFLN